MPDEFAIHSGTGRISPARYVASPNCDARPEGTPINLLVVHGISLPPGEFGGRYIEDLFCNRLDWNAHPYFDAIRGLKVSAHLLIRRDAELLQFVPFTRRAWHCGASFFRGRDCCNDFSIGIELEGEDDCAYEDAQYETLARVVKAIQHAYPAISNREVVAHSDIAPCRKTDPGPAFDWQQLYDEFA